MIRFLLITASVAGLMAGTAANAQSSPAASTDQASSDQAATATADAGANDDIVVTATRDSTVLSKTPVAVTAVTATQLRDSGITNPTLLAARVPNLDISRNNGLQITIRGVTSSDQTEKGDPSAAFMLDGTYIARVQSFESSFYDVQRIEVLRGPQGTLFGRNTTAGLVNVISNDPDISGFGGSIDATYGNYDTRQLTAVLNLPLSDTVAVRAAGNYDYRDSYVIAGPRFTTSMSPYKENYSGRVSALFDLGDARLVLRADYSDIGGQLASEVLTANFFSNFGNDQTPIWNAAGKSSEELRTANYGFSGPLRSKDNTWGVSADLKWDIGRVTLNYLGSYRNFHRDEYNLFAQSPNAVGTYSLFNYGQNSQELRLSTDDFGPFKAQVGVYYFSERADASFANTGLGGVAPGTLGYIVGQRSDPVKSDSYAAFGQTTLSLSDTLRFTAGIRYSKDHKERTGYQVTCVTFACDGATDRKVYIYGDRSFSKTTWRLGADWDLSPATLVYGSVATGYKAGGFNDGCQIGTAAGCTVPENLLYYDPEQLTAYEVGIKTRFLDNAVRLSASAFHYDYTQLQVNQVGLCGVTICSVTQNAAAAKIDGVEVEGVIAPARTSVFDFSLAYLNARYTQFAVNATTNWADVPLNRSPEWSATLGYTQTIDLANGGNLKAGARTKILDNYIIAVVGSRNLFRIPSTTNTEATLTYNAPQDRYYVQAFAKNLENNIVPTNIGTGLFPRAQTSDPLTYGARVGFHF